MDVEAVCQADYLFIYLLLTHSIDPRWKENQLHIKQSKTTHICITAHNKK